MSYRYMCPFYEGSIIGVNYIRRYMYDPIDRTRNLKREMIFFAISSHKR